MAKQDYINELFTHKVLFGATRQELLKTLSFIEEDDKNEVVVSKKDFLNKRKFEYICSIVHRDKILIRTNAHDVMSKEEIEVAKECIACAAKSNKQIYFENGFTLEQASRASAQVNDWIKMINEAKVDGKELSPYEKYLMAYQIAASFTYKEEDINENPWLSRDLNLVLNGNLIVCFGFSSLLKCLCDGVGIKCKLEDVTLVEYGLPNEEICHSACCVSIDDKKYGISGIYFADPTNDSRKRKYGSMVNLSLVPYTKAKKMLGPDSEVVVEENKNSKIRTYIREQMQEEKMVCARVSDFNSFAEEFKKLLERKTKTVVAEELKKLLKSEETEEKLGISQKLFINKDIMSTLNFNGFYEYAIKELQKNGAFEENLKNACAYYLNLKATLIKETCQKIANDYKISYNLASKQMIDLVSSRNFFDSLFSKDALFVYDRYRKYLRGQVNKAEEIAFDSKIKALFCVELAKGKTKEKAAEIVATKIVKSAKFAISYEHYGYEPIAKMYKEKYKQNKNITENQFYDELYKYVYSVVNVEITGNKAQGTEQSS